MQFRGGMNELIRQASRMQRKVADRKEALKAELFEAKSGNDQVVAVANGDNAIVSLQISPELLKNESVEMVSDMVVAAVNAALQKARTSVEAELEKVAGGVNIPGLF